MKKIVLAEDDLSTRLVVVKLLESMGHAVIQASSGTRAINVLADNRDVALLITDFMMPDLDGKMLVRAVRADPSHSKLPILMMSGVVRLDEIASVLELGVDRFISKPIKTDELKEYVALMLDR